VKKIKTASFEFLTAVLMQIKVFWNDVPCELANNYDVSDGKMHPSSGYFTPKCFGP